jgi:hypothetical protein
MKEDEIVYAVIYDSDVIKYSVEKPEEIKSGESVMPMYKKEADRRFEIFFNRGKSY